MACYSLFFFFFFFFFWSLDNGLNSPKSEWGTKAKKQDSINLVLVYHIISLTPHSNATWARKKIAWATPTVWSALNSCYHKNNWYQILNLLTSSAGMNLNAQQIPLAASLKRPFFRPSEHQAQMHTLIFSPHWHL